MNASEHPTPKRETPDRLASTEGDEKLNCSRLQRDTPAVNPQPGSKRELLRATAECLLALREFAGSGGGAK